MAYTKTTFVNGGAPAISAEELNKIGQGIKDAHDNKMDKTATIRRLIKNGVIVTVRPSNATVTGLPAGYYNFESIVIADADKWYEITNITLIASTSQAGCWLRASYSIEGGTRIYLPTVSIDSNYISRNIPMVASGKKIEIYIEIYSPSSNNRIDWKTVAVNGKENDQYTISQL